MATQRWGLKPGIERRRLRWRLRALVSWTLGWGLIAISFPLLTLFSVLTLRLGVAYWFPWVSRLICGSLLGICGVAVRVTGAERLAGRRPRIVVFNHSSQLDLFVGGWLMPPHGTVVAKREFLFVPIVGLAFWAFRFLLVDRRNAERARRAMDVAALRVASEGASVIIAPEGTRSRSGELGPFKMGVFHLALATRAPIVPVVLRGARECQPMGAVVPLPGVVRADVLPEIATDDYTGDNLKAKRDELREVYLAALAEEDESDNE